eukprot:9851603-Alexandrium_andersonii.AAC.1
MLPKHARQGGATGPSLQQGLMGSRPAPWQAPPCGTRTYGVIDHAGSHRRMRALPETITLSAGTPSKEDG